MPITAKAQVTVTWDATRPPWWIKPMLELIASGETAGEARTGRIVQGPTGARVRAATKKGKPE